MLARDAEQSAGVLDQMKTIGVKLAIDDFGTGYSSLSYLREFPVDSIKIDRSFINELHRSPTSTALIDAVVNLSRALGAYTVAEGIEHRDQVDLLERLGCDRGQGFYFCRPLAGPALTSLLREHAADTAEDSRSRPGASPPRRSTSGCTTSRSTRASPTSTVCRRSSPRSTTTSVRP